MSKVEVIIGIRKSGRYDDILLAEFIHRSKPRVLGL